MTDPIPMILACPACGARHVDAGRWATRPHHTHACQHCGVVWRPAVVCTVGVQFLPGFRDGDREMLRSAVLGLDYGGRPPVFEVTEVTPDREGHPIVTGVRLMGHSDGADDRVPAGLVAEGPLPCNCAGTPPSGRACVAHGPAGSGFYCQRDYRAAGHYGGGEEYARRPGTPLAEHVRRVRERHPSAYEPWNPMLDAALRSWAGEEDDRALARRFGRTTGAIHSRLVRLGVRQR